MTKHRMTADEMPEPAETDKPAQHIRGGQMKKVVNKYGCFMLLLYILGQIIDFCINDDTRPPPVKDYPLIEFEKEEYQVKDMVNSI